MKPVFCIERPEEGLRSDRCISRAVCLQVLLTGIKNMLFQALPGVYAAQDTVNMIALVVVGVIYVHAFLTLFRRMASIGPWSLGFVLFLVFSFLLTAFFHPENQPVILERLPRLLSYCILTCFMISRLTTLAWLPYYMERYSYLLVLVAVFCGVVISSNGHVAMSDYSEYSMSLSAVALVAVIWLLALYFCCGRFLPLAGAIAGTIIILLFGARSPLLALFAYVLICSLRRFSNRGAPVLVRALYLLCSAAMGALLLFRQRIMLGLDRLLASLSLYSRSVRLLTAEEISDSGRGYIHEALIKWINSEPILGLGVCGDETCIGVYAHGLYLGILATYGYVLGTALLLLLAYMCARAWRVSSGWTRETLLLYLCMVVPRGFVAVDLWHADVVWWLLGVVLVILEQSRRGAVPALRPDAAPGRRALSAGKERS